MMMMMMMMIMMMMTVYTYGCHIATTTRGIGSDPGALRNSLRKKKKINK